MRKHKTDHYVGVHTLRVYDMKEFMSDAPTIWSGMALISTQILSGAHIKPGLYWKDRPNSDYYRVLYLIDHTRVSIEGIAANHSVIWRCK